jgi:alpha-N-arabinofuranosidase
MRKSLLALSVAMGMSLSGMVSADTVLSIDTTQKGPLINKNVYGQFAEHLGRGIYEGLYVGEKSKIANTKGWRNDVLNALKEIKVPLVRWPGGCFADEYHWRDGIGAQKNRAVRVNTNWGGVLEDNAVGTHEFFELAELLGAETYVNANLGTGTPQEAAEWMEYMTSEGKSSLAELRRKNGRDKPFKVDYYAIGNEAWGCGGNMTPDYYMHLYNHWNTFIKAPKDNRPKMIASGGHTDDTSWTETILSMAKTPVAGISFHFYTLPTGNWDKKGAARNFPESEWFSTFVQTQRMNDFILTNKKVMDEKDPQKKVGFYVDEWGTWYDVEEGTNPGFLYQQNTLRDALVAAVNFNIFHLHADRVHMSNIAQMVNVLQAMILTDKEKMVKTPTYYAYKMFVPFQDATSLPIDIKTSDKYTLGDKSLDQVSVSAAIGKDGHTYISLVNLHPTKAAPVKASLAGKNVTQTATGEILTHEKMDAHNDFATPDVLTPSAFSADVVNGTLSVDLPAKSIVVLKI